MRSQDAKSHATCCIARGTTGMRSQDAKSHANATKQAASAKTPKRSPGHEHCTANTLGYAKTKPPKVTCEMASGRHHFCIHIDGHILQQAVEREDAEDGLDMFLTETPIQAKIDQYLLI